jgi:hypothetical protein
LTQSNPVDGRWMTRVELTITYWQKSLTEKILTKFEIAYKDFVTLTDAQAKGNEPWKYKLGINYKPVSWIDVYNQYGFGIGVYILVRIYVY